jgi:DNA repair ATPase RecN
VWKNYDINNQLVESDWQRCWSLEDIQRKCLEIRDESVRLERLNKIKHKYKESTMNIKYYEQEFEQMMKGIIDDKNNLHTNLQESK